MVSLTNKGTNTAAQGKTEKVYTPGINREIEVRHKVVEADSLITSNDANGAVNLNFPQHLQPRDRSRPTSIAQVHDIASNLNPKLLGENQVLPAVHRLYLQKVWWNQAMDAPWPSVKPMRQARWSL